MQIKIINQSKHPLPRYETEESSGVDLRAHIEYPIVLKPLERALIPTGLFVEIPQGYEAQIRPRSGLALKKGLSILNAPGTIDSDYRGEIKVILVNLSGDHVEVNDGERICQMIFAPVAQAQFSEVENIGESGRGAGGFGHTGI